MTTRDYICECPGRRCRERLYLTPTRYQHIRALDLNVVHPDHVGAWDVLVALEPGYAVILTGSRRAQLQRLREGGNRRADSASVGVQVFA